MMTNDCGPAFPQQFKTLTGGFDGLSVRDYMACQALIGYHRLFNLAMPEILSENITKCCYKLADAMLRERKRERANE